MPVPVPDGVKVSVDAGVFTAKGKLGEMKVKIVRDMTVAIEGAEVLVTRPSDSKTHRSLHGLTRSLVNSAVVGVSQGFSKTLEIVGVGYRAELKGKDLLLNLGFSHPVLVKPPEGVQFSTPKQTEIIIQGIDKQAVGQVAAEIRKLRPPEPYKGKGVKYQGEIIRRKAGKSAAAA
jgi:large subunit ribosomal protein L6